MLEMYEDLYAKREELRDALEGLDRIAQGGVNVAGQRRSMLEQLNNVNRALGEPEEVFDELVDRWEKAIARGEVPDLEARV